MFFYDYFFVLQVSVYFAPILAFIAFTALGLLFDWQSGA